MSNVDAINYRYLIHLYICCWQALNSASPLVPNVSLISVHLISIHAEDRIEKVIYGNRVQSSVVSEWERSDH